MRDVAILNDKVSVRATFVQFITDDAYVVTVGTFHEAIRFCVPIHVHDTDASDVMSIDYLFNDFRASDDQVENVIFEANVFEIRSVKFLFELINNFEHVCTFVVPVDVWAHGEIFIE